MKENRTNMVLNKSLAFLVLAVALGVAQTVRADYWAWNGSATSPSYWDDLSLWLRSGSNTDFKRYNHNIMEKWSAGKAFAAGWDKTITFRNVSLLSNEVNQVGTLTFSAGSPQDPIVFAAERDDYGIWSSANLLITGEDDADSCLEIQSGTYRFALVNLANSQGKNGTIKVGGGALATGGNLNIGTAGTGYLNVSGGVVSAGTMLNVGYGGVGYLNISGGLVRQSASGNTSYLHLGFPGTGTVTVTSGAYENIDGNGNLTIGHSAGSVGTLNVQGGAVTIKGTMLLSYNASTISATVNVTDGGVLTANKIMQSNAGVEGNKVTVDGGTVRAYASNASFMPAGSNFRLYAGANGATFDAATFDITIGEDIDDKPGETGNVTFAGDGGTIRLTGALNYSGATYLNEKTHLVVKDTAMLESLLTKGLTVARPPDSTVPGTFTILSIADGTPCTVADYARITKGTGLEHATFGIDNGAITITVTDSSHTWAGASGVSATWSGANWDEGVTFNHGDNALFATDGAIAEIDALADAHTLTFNEGAALTGTGSLIAPTISVAANAEATIAPQTLGTLEKTGAGTLTLGASRTYPTVLTEGTLAMTDGATLDWSKFTFGTDAQKPLALRLSSGATLENVASKQFSFGATANGTVEFYKECGDMTSAGLAMASGKNATARFYHSGGTYVINGYAYMGWNSNSDSAVTYFEISGGTVTNATNYLSIGRRGAAGCESVMTVKAGGTYGACGALLVGNEASGILNVEGGTVLVGSSYVGFCYAAGCGAGEDCAVNITQGGTLAAKQVKYVNSSAAALATLRFDNGTLRASADNTSFMPAHARLTVTVDAGGGTIDTDGYAVTIGEDLTGTGGMTYAGGGKVTLSKAPAYSGKTTVEVGTQLVVPSVIAGANLVFTAPAGIEEGTYAAVTISGSGTFADSVLNDITKPEGFTARLSANKKTIYCGDSVGKAVWIGGTSASLNDGENWLLGSVPNGGDVVIRCLADSTLINPAGSSFAATSITFPEHSAKVTIGGVDAISGLLAITNLAAQHHVFNVPVTFVDGATASITMSEASYMDFAGGVTMYNVATGSGARYCGTFTVTTDGDWNVDTDSVLMENSELNLPNGTYYDHLHRLTIESGAMFTVKNVKMNAGGEGNYKHLLNKNDGVFNVLEEAYICTSPRNYDLITQWGGAYLENTRGKGVCFFNKLRLDYDGLLIVPATTIIGPGGILRDTGRGIVRMLNSGTHAFGSYADWTMCEAGNDDSSNPIFIKQGGESRCTLTFDTSDWYDATVPRKITCRAPICGNGVSQAGYIFVIVKGNGEFAFETSYDDASAWKVFAGGLTVQDEATVSVKPRCNPGKGAVTMGSGTTLKVAGSGTVALGGALTLADDTTLAFNFTERNVTPVLVATNGVTVAETVNVKVSSTGKVRPVGGDHVLTTGGGFTGKTVSLVTDGLPHWMTGGSVSVNGDGNIVLSVVSDGTILLFK